MKNQSKKIIIHVNQQNVDRYEILKAFKNHLSFKKEGIFSCGNGFTINEVDTTKKHFDEMPARWENGNLIIPSLMNLDL